MRDLGYVEGKDFTMEWRFADGNYDLFPALAEEIVRLQVSAIVLGSTAAVRPTQRVTTTIPIVMGIAVDPVANGFVQSLAHPGGNTTGLASSVEDTSSKQIELLATTLPKLSRVGLLANTASPITAIVLKGAQAFAQGAGVTIEVANASNPQDIDGAISTLKKARVGGILVIPDALFMTNRLQIANFALAERLPTFFSQREYVEAGGLLSYGENLKDFFRFVDKILKGAKPGDLPIEQPTRFFLVINLKTAKTLGLAVPPTLLAVADEVIE